MLCYSAEENQQEYCHISNVDDPKAEFGVMIIDLSFHTNVWRLSPFPNIT